MKEIQQILNNLVEKRFPDLCISQQRLHIDKGTAYGYGFWLRYGYGDNTMDTWRGATFLGEGDAWRAIIVIVNGGSLEPDLNVLLIFAEKISLKYIEITNYLLESLKLLHFQFSGYLF